MYVKENVNEYTNKMCFDFEESFIEHFASESKKCVGNIGLVADTEFIEYILDSLIPYDCFNIAEYEKDLLGNHSLLYIENSGDIHICSLESDGFDVIDTSNCDKLYISTSIDTDLKKECQYIDSQLYFVGFDSDTLFDEYDVITEHDFQSVEQEKYI